MHSAASIWYGILVAVAVAWGAGLAAQTAEAPAASPPAKIANMFKTATNTAERTAAYAALAPFAKAGHRASQRIMARELMRDARYPEALATLAPLIAANDRGGLDLAAKLIGHRKFGTVPPALALDIYERLAEMGDMAALGQVAKAHLAGQTGRMSAEKIRSALDRAATGDMPNLAAYLAEFQTKGMGGPVDKAGAIASLKLAAKTGRKDSILNLATALMDSQAETDIAQSLALLTSMADANGKESQTAKIRLIIGHATGGFGQNSDLGAALALTPQVLAGAGATKAATLLLRAAGRAKAAPEWRALLQQIVQDQIAAGNLTHLDALFDHYTVMRDAESLAAAQRLYDRYKGQITSNLQASFLIMQNIQNGTAMANAADLVQMIHQTKDKYAREQAYLASLADQNFYIYALQSLAQIKGYYKGTLTGQMDSATLRAFAKLCSDAGVQDACATGPLKRKNAHVIARAVAGLPATEN